MNKINTSVVICGAGPAGLTLAHLLAEDNIDVVLVEQLSATVTEPRAIALDGESLRTLQKLDLFDGFKAELLSGLEAEYVNGKGEILFQFGRPDFRPYGYPSINSFDQPALDRYLAASLKSKPNVDLRFNHQLSHFEQDEASVRVYCSTGDNEELEINADFLIACDGGRSTIRSLLNIDMQGESNAQPWLVIDTKDAHLDGQLDCRFFCDPKRPGMTIRKRHGERRWEWMLMPGENRESLLEDDVIRAMISDYTDADQVDIYRKRVYDFHAIIADSWSEGRVFLAGDAAHMTPPFAGQGLNSGLRDVSNLSWKLAAVVKGQADINLLESYQKDRKDHAWELIETALNLGKQIQPIDVNQAEERDAFFAELNKNPAAMQQLEADLTKSITERKVGGPLVIDSDLSDIVGRLLIQPELQASHGQILLDQYLGFGFSIIGFNCDPNTALSSSTLNRWQAMGANIVSINSSNSNSEAVLLDTNDALSEWLGSTDPVVLLVRPDRFCMVCSSPEQSEQNFVRAYNCVFNGSDV